MFHRSLGVREQGHPTGSHANPFSTHARARINTHTLNSPADKQKDRETDRQASREPCKDSGIEGWVDRKTRQRQTRRRVKTERQTDTDMQINLRTRRHT